jgi:uncharacterized Zn-binding protein involved in type VI secretion
MGQPAARMGDFHACPMVTPGTPPIPHVGGPILPTCSINVLTGKIPQARVTDKCLCVGPPDVIVKGSMTVLVNKLPAARMFDSTAHGGVIMKGELTVLIGDAGAGGGGGAMLDLPGLAKLFRMDMKSLAQLNALPGGSKFLAMLAQNATRSPFASQLKEAGEKAKVVSNALTKALGYGGGTLLHEATSSSAHAALVGAIGLMKGIKEGVRWSDLSDVADGLIKYPVARNHYLNLLKNNLGADIAKGVLSNFAGDLAHEIALHQGASPYVAELDRQLVMSVIPAIGALEKSKGIPPLAIALYAGDRAWEITKASGGLITDTVHNFDTAVKQADEIRLSADVLAREAISKGENPQKYYKISADQSSRIAEYYQQHPVAAVMAEIPGIRNISNISHTPIAQSVVNFLF